MHKIRASQSQGISHGSVATLKHDARAGGDTTTHKP